MQYRDAIKKVFQKEQSDKTDQFRIKTLEQNILTAVNSRFVNVKNNAFLYRISTAVAVLVIFLIIGALPRTTNNDLPKSPVTQTPKKIDYIAKFSSEDEFKNYIAIAKDLHQPPSVTPNIDVQPQPPVEKTERLEPSLLNAPGDTDTFAQPQQPQRSAFEKKPAVDIVPPAIAPPYRLSQTNVQVLDIDEPDIVKNDKRNIYYSSNYPLKIIHAFPPSNLAKIGTIDKLGELLLYKDVLVIIEDSRIIYGFDVSNPSKPFEKWKITLAENTHVTQARLYNGKIYLVTQTSINKVNPCPIPIIYGQSNIVIPCTEIYHPKVYVPSDVTYTTMSIQVENGIIEDKVTFVGSAGSSIVYMSSNALYITYQIRSFSEEHKANLQKTGIVKIRLSGLSIITVGEVPGRPLNQFSLDEYQGNLRVATTLERDVFGSFESTNEVYVLDSNLQIVGSVKNLGLKERIYSVRFIGDKAYLVTFREIDPFYVIDLSDPRNPMQKGELKIPGFSSYLHPIGENKMLGIGREGAQVKITLFDISSPSNPSELDTYRLTDYSSEILETHHAFLHDEKHRAFFIPAGNAGYIFSYQDNHLYLIRTINDIQARRAFYLNDYMYILGDNKIVVLNELSWQQVSQLEF